MVIPNLINYIGNRTFGHETKDCMLFADNESLIKMRTMKSGDGKYLWVAGLEVKSQSTFFGIKIYRCERKGLSLGIKLKSGLIILSDYKG